MEFEVGDKVIRKNSENKGFVHSKRSGRALMLEVRWETDGSRQWLPAEEFKPWDKTEAPPPVSEGWRGRTTPAYLVGLTRSKQVQDERHLRFARKSKSSIDTLADALVGLGKKNKSLNKARKMIAKFEREAGQ